MTDLERLRAAIELVEQADAILIECFAGQVDARPQLALASDRLGDVSAGLEGILSTLEKHAAKTGLFRVPSLANPFEEPTP